MHVSFDLLDSLTKLHFSRIFYLLKTLYHILLKVAFTLAYWLTMSFSSRLVDFDYQIIPLKHLSTNTLYGVKLFLGSDDLDVPNYSPIDT